MVRVWRVDRLNERIELVPGRVGDTLMDWARRQPDVYTLVDVRRKLLEQCSILACVVDVLCKGWCNEIRERLTAKQQLDAMEWILYREYARLSSKQQNSDTR